MMDLFRTIWVEASVQTRLVILNEVMTVGAGLFLILWWFLSGHLQKATVWGWWEGVTLSGGLILLAVSGQSSAALWVLIGALVIAISVDVFLHGLESFAVAGYIVPIALGGVGIGISAALGTAIIGSVWIAGLAWAKRRAWYRPPFQADTTCFAFNGPVIMVIFFYLAAILAVIPSLSS